MISRIALSVLSTALAFAAAAPLHAAPAAAMQATPSVSVTYHIERHNQQVTVKDTDGNTLTKFSAVTPTLHGLFAWSATRPATGTLRILTLTLMDQNGRRLWSTPVWVNYPQTISVNYNNAAGGTQLAISPAQEDTPHLDSPPASGLPFVIGADGRPLSFGDSQHEAKFVYEPHGFWMVDPAGKVLAHADYDANNSTISSPAELNAHLNQDGTGAMIINGVNIAIDTVTKGDKDYQTFPWNGHKVSIERGCTWSVTTDGDLTINAPSAGK